MLEPTLYSTWKQFGSKGVQYFIIYQKSMQEGKCVKLTLLRLFDPEFSEVTPEQFKELEEKKAITEWKP